MKHSYQIDYENVKLRPLIKDDIENLRIWRNNPKNTLYLSKIPFITEEMQAAWFERYLSNEDELCFAIVESRVLNRMVGSLSLHDFSEDSCFLGKILIGDDEAHGRKVGLNASIAATKIAFERLNMKSVNLQVFAENMAAFNVYTNAGFTIVNEHLTASGKKEYFMKIDRRIMNA